MNERDVKYNAFVESDEKNNRGRLVNSCAELGYLLKNPTVNEIFSKHYLNDILAYATTFSEYYKNYRGFKSLSDFPIMKKQDLKDNWDLIAIKEIPADEVITKYTSGSTGTPFKMIMDKYKHARWIAGNKELRAIDGVRSHEKTMFISANVADKKIPMERQDRDNVYYLDYRYLGDDEFSEILNRMEEENFKTMTAISSVYEALAKYIKAGKAPAWKGDLIAVFAMSELLKESTREVIQDYFKCPMYSYYANEENGAFAIEDGSGNGHLVNTVDYFFEVLKMDCDEPAEDGEVGRLVITDYFNKAFPVIRYENGDLVSMKHMEDGSVYIQKIMGRVADVLYTTDGVMVDIFHAISFLEPFQDIKQFQLVQHDYDQLTWVLNTDNHSYEEFIVQESKKLFGENVSIKFEYVNEIPKLRSGKTRMTVCQITENNK
ncbi:MAG: phenylacetate--CoA ligase family protein [Agathobacter sp.]|nr:phenylacetate--CoA ligase family protein [Agathobacter sp.]